MKEEITKMYWIFHNGITIDAVSSKEDAIQLALEIKARHPHSRAHIQFMPIVG